MLPPRAQPKAMQWPATLLAFAHAAWALQDDLVPTPPMGYNSWNDLECQPSEGKLRDVAKRLKDLGLLALGYKYVVVDDCWMAGRRDSGNTLVADAKRFPSGIRALADHVHSLGFKFGIYTSRGVHTCVGRPASMDHEELDAKTFASWGVDYLKNDGCADPDCGKKMKQFRERSTGLCPKEGRRKALAKYALMHAALNSTGRHIVHSICGWQPWYAVVGRRIGHLWRVGADVRDWAGIYEATRIMEQLSGYHGPNGWNDPDMLIGSSSGARLALSPLQARAQFSLWAVLPAPLMLGAAVLELSAVDREIYGNAEAIRVNQDRLGLAAKVAFSNCPPYPTFDMRDQSGPDADPFDVDFVVNFSGTADPENGVSCGRGVRAADCTSCLVQRGPGGNKQSKPRPNCGGDCHQVRGEPHCVLKPTSKRLRDGPVEDRYDPWRRSTLRSERMRQCQQVWTKALHGGDVALAAVNFATVERELLLPLARLGLLWAGPGVALRDLSAPSAMGHAAPAQIGNASLSADYLRLWLAPDGGHVLLRLGPGPRASPGPTAAAKSDAATALGSWLFLFGLPASFLLGLIAERATRLCCRRQRKRSQLLGVQP